MEKIILYNCKCSLKVRQLAGALRIKVLEYNTSVLENTLAQLLEKNVKDIEENDLVNPPQIVDDNRSLLIMCDLSDKHVDKLLAKLKENKLDVGYKAVLTPTNVKWTMKRMLAQMEFEESRL